MKIAQVSPLYESVPPKLYGGTERIVSYLTEELVHQGHDVTLFASGDSKTSARLVATVPEALRLKEICEDMLAPHLAQLEDVRARADEFDFIHFHTDYLNFPFAQFLATPHVTTLHGKLTIPELKMLYQRFSTQPLLGISDSQIQVLPEANIMGRVHHGLPADLFYPGTGQGGYFAFLGRISPEKRCDRAIEIAIATNTPLKIAAKVDKADREYYEEKIKHLMEHPLVEYIGETGEEGKQELLANAKALLFPIDWPEPFGIVMIEAMASGTPVIAWNNGSVPEIIEEGITGFVVNSHEEAVNAVGNLQSISRSRVRSVFEKRFTATRMAEDYLRFYNKLIMKNSVSKFLEGKNITSSVEDDTI